MKISYNWLRQYLDIDQDSVELADIMTNIGLEVEGIEDWISVEGGLDGVLIGEVKFCEKHPNADTLFITKVDVGYSELLDVVCGAPNVAVGQKVPVATVGTVLNYKGKEFTIKKSKIRGELSEGMICAEDELGLGDTHEGIMVLPEDTKIGIAASEYFKIEKDIIFEIGLTPNRIDSGSHFGVARDLAAYFNIKNECKAHLPSISSFKVDNNDNHIPIIVENSKDCPRYSGITISGVKIEESPEWLKNRLKALDLSPINNIVDITNYVLNEIGQPLHAFDADMIKGKKVIIKNLPDKTKFQTLDEEVRELSAMDLMICNENDGMCIAGVFGGIKSGVTHTTKNIFLESAYFKPVSIRKTARRHDLSTDASFHFERGADPNITVWALKRAALMIKEIAGGKISSEIVDIYPKKIDNPIIIVRWSNINRLIGKDIGKDTVKIILESLDIILKEEINEELKVEVPAYRVDVTREADIIEEIMRIYGYNNIEISNKVKSTLTYIGKPDKEKVVNSISDMLSGYGYMEIMSNSLNPLSWFENSQDFNNRTLVKLANPLSNDLNVMRQTLLFGGLTAIARNINRQNPDLRFYEFGNCYFIDENIKKDPLVKDFTEKQSLDLFVSGNRDIQNWSISSEPTNFADIKSSLEMVLEKLGFEINSFDLESYKREYYSEGLSYQFKGKMIASFGKISKKYLERFDLKQDVYYGHVEWDTVLDLIKSHTLSFRELPKYPSVRRDLALLIDSKISFEQVRKLAFKNERNILRHVGLFDVYESNTLGEDKKSYAISFILRDDKRTLTDKTIDKVMNGLMRVFEKDLGAQIR